MKKYSCSLDKLAKTVPWFITILAVVSVGMLYYTSRVTGRQLPPLAFIVSGILLPVMIISMYLLQPRYILANSDAIKIARRVMPVTIRFADIVAIKKVNDLQFSIRTFGNGGMFGYTGKYYKKDIGNMTWYCTQRANYVIIEKSDKKKIVITPDDVEGFMRDMTAVHAELTRVS